MINGVPSLFNQVTVTVEPSVIFRPVPEPSTYGVAAIAGLVLAVFYGRRRRRESAGTADVSMPV